MKISFKKYLIAFSILISEIFSNFIRNFYINVYGHPRDEKIGLEFLGNKPPKNNLQSRGTLLQKSKPRAKAGGKFPKRTKRKEEYS